MDMTSQRHRRTIKYKINAKCPKALIEEVRVSRESANFVYVGNFGYEHREAKHCEDHEYHDTWEDAFFALTNVVNRRLMAAQEELRLAQELVNRVCALREDRKDKPG